MKATSPVVDALLKSLELLATTIQSLQRFIASSSSQQPSTSNSAKVGLDLSQNEAASTTAGAGMEKVILRSGGISPRLVGPGSSSIYPAPVAPSSLSASKLQLPERRNTTTVRADHLNTSFLEASVVGVQALKQMRSLRTVSVQSLNKQTGQVPGGELKGNDAASEMSMRSPHRPFDGGLGLMTTHNHLDRSGQENPPATVNEPVDEATSMARANPAALPSISTGGASTAWSRQLPPGLLKNQSVMTALTVDEAQTLPLPVSEFHGTVVVDECGNAVLCHFEILAELGKGNFGKVSLVMDADGELFALKTLRDRRVMMNLPGGRTRGRKSVPAASGNSTTNLVTGSAQQSISSDHSSSTPEASKTAEVNLVEREIAVMKRLNHPNVVKLHAVIEDPEEGQTHLVMQYVDNGPIGKVASDNTCHPLPFTLALKYMAQVARGLEYLHSQNIIHRDIKPENILIGSDDTAYLSDFGVSSILTDGLFGMVGTMSFFSPELLASHSALEQYGKESDVWAFGVTLYCLLFGRLPFTGRTGPELMRSILMDDVVIPERLPELRVPEELPLDGLQAPSDSTCPFLLRHVGEVQKLSSSRPVPPELNFLLLRLLDRNPSTRLTLTSFRKFARHPERLLQQPNNQPRSMLKNMKAVARSTVAPTDGLSDPVAVSSQQPAMSRSGNVVPVGGKAPSNMHPQPHRPGALAGDSGPSNLPPQQPLPSLLDEYLNSQRDALSESREPLGFPHANSLRPTDPSEEFARSTTIEVGAQQQHTQSDAARIERSLRRHSTAPYRSTEETDGTDIGSSEEVGAENPLMLTSPRGRMRGRIEGGGAASPSPESLSAGSSSASLPSRYSAIEEDITEEETAEAIVQCNVIVRRMTNPNPTALAGGQSMMMSTRPFVPLGQVNAASLLLSLRMREPPVAGHDTFPALTTGSPSQPPGQLTSPKPSSGSPFVSRLRGSAIDARET